MILEAASSAMLPISGVENLADIRAIAAAPKLSKNMFSSCLLRLTSGSTLNAARVAITVDHSRGLPASEVVKSWMFHRLLGFGGFFLFALLDLAIFPFADVS